MTKSLFRLNFLLDLYVTLHLSIRQTTLYLQRRMDIPIWILARRIQSPPNSISLFPKSLLLLNALNYGQFHVSDPTTPVYPIHRTAGGPVNLSLDAYRPVTYSKVTTQTMAATVPMTRF
jgi:hypothetical protein